MTSLNPIYPDTAHDPQDEQASVPNVRLLANISYRKRVSTRVSVAAVGQDLLQAPRQLGLLGLFSL